MTDNDDKMTEQFFKDHTREIPDNGFTEKVMRSLPESKRWWADKIWTMICVTAMVVFSYTNNCWASLDDTLQLVTAQLTTSLADSMNDIRVTGSILILLITLTYMKAKDVIYNNEL